jgi:hypothetical protein
MMIVLQGQIFIFLAAGVCWSAQQQQPHSQADCMVQCICVWQIGISIIFA